MEHFKDKQGGLPIFKWHILVSTKFHIMILQTSYFNYRIRFITLVDSSSFHLRSRLLIKSEASIWNLKTPVFSASTKVIQRCSVFALRSTGKVTKFFIAIFYNFY